MKKRAIWRVGLSAIAIALAAFALAVPAAAQEQVGAIRGVVSDASLAVLPGASIEAVSTGGARLQTTTSATGEYRFPRVPPGTYSVTARLDGFTPKENQGVLVSLGVTVTVDFTLEVGEVSETISVVGEATQIDLRSSATAATISAEQINYLPKGRDFTSIATQAAGVANEGFLGGISVDGASGSENRFVIDGIDTTHPQDGLSGQNLVTDFLEEVQVKSAGYQAEYGGSVGGVINAVTKSGTNEFNGWVGVYYGESGWNGDERITPYESAPGHYRQFDKDDTTTTEPGFAIGGPIVKDKAWFYAGYTYTEAEIDRTPEGGRPTANRNDKREYYAINLKGNVGSRFLYKVSGNAAPRDVDGNLPAKDGTTPAAADLSVLTEFDTESYSAYADFIPTDNFYVSGRVGHYETDTKDSGLEATAQVFFRNGTIPVPTTSPLYRPAGFVSFPGNSSISTDLWERDAASVDANLFVNGAGSHAFKGGVQYEKINNEVSRGEAVNLYTFRWGLADRFGAGVKGTYGSLGVRRFRTEGAAESKNLGFYLQDSWSIVPNFTLNIGVRTEKEEVPNYGAKVDPTLPKNAIEFDYGDKLAPRIGFAWDVFSDAKLKVYGSWGTYYDITKIEMPRGSFGADKWIEYLWPVNTTDWVSLLASGNCHTSTNNPADNPCPGLGSPEVTLDLRHPTDPADAIDPDLKPMEQEELQLGADYQLTRNSTIGARFVYKDLKNTIEDIGYLVETAPGVRQEEYITGNPGKGIVAGDPDGSGPIPAQPEAIREYKALELTWHRRFADNWSATVGYTYSELTGDYSGLASSDEFGRTDPNVSRSFDALHNAFDLNGNLVDGELNTDRPHQIDAQFIYHFDWGTSVGVNQYYGRGTPISTQWSYIGVPFFPHGRKSAGRTDDLTQTDLLLSHQFDIGNFSLEVSLNVINLFDEDTALLIDNNEFRGDLCDADDCDGSYDYFFGGGLDPAVLAGSENPFYLQPNTGVSFGNPYQQPRTVRVGVKFLF